MRYYDAKDVLAAMAELYRHKKHWTTGAFARDRDGNDLCASNPNAVCYCMSGAIMKLSGETSVMRHAQDYVTRAIIELFPRVKWRDIPHFNDARSRTIEQVRRVVGRARELADAV